MVVEAAEGLDQYQRELQRGLIALTDKISRTHESGQMEQGVEIGHEVRDTGPLSTWMPPV